MTDKEAAESMVRGLGKELGREVPLELAVELGAILISKLGGGSWDDARAAGAEARARITTVAEAERSRLERLKDT